MAVIAVLGPPKDCFWPETFKSRETQPVFEKQLVSEEQQTKENKKRKGAYPDSTHDVEKIDF